MVCCPFSLVNRSNSRVRWNHYLRPRLERLQEVIERVPSDLLDLCGIAAKRMGFMGHQKKPGNPTQIGFEIAKTGVLSKT